MKPLLLPAFALVAIGCATTQPDVSGLEAEVRRLRTEQERQAAQIDQIRNRLMLTEDTARAARTAVEGAHGRTISLGTDAPPAEPIRVDSTTRGVDPPEEPADNGSRTTIRAARGDRAPDPAGFTVLPPGERLPVVPVAPMPVPNQANPPRPGPLPPTPPAPMAPTGGRGPSAAADVPMVPVHMGTGMLDPSAVPAYEEALAMARGGRCADAVGAFTRFLERWPEHPHADNAMYWRAECFLRGGDAPRAVQEFEGLLARFPAGNKVADALYKLAVTYGRMGDADRAARATQRLTAEFPDSEAARRIRGERE
ncbi:MAG: tetratricopeptide repeat protein [Polyangiales bacterium]